MSNGVQQVDELPAAGRLPRVGRRSEVHRSPLEIVAPLGVPLMAGVLVVFFSLDTSGFLTATNIKNIFNGAALPTLVAVGLTIVLVMGDFDLSIAAIAGVTTILFAAFV